MGAGHWVGHRFRPGAMPRPLFCPVFPCRGSGGGMSPRDVVLLFRLTIVRGLAARAWDARQPTRPERETGYRTGRRLGTRAPQRKGRRE